MSVSGLPDASLVTRPGELGDLAKVLSGEKIIAVDTESNSLHAYREQVCLIQFSTLDTDYLVDPLALADLSPLDPIFADPGIEKVFHAAEYDLICLKRDFNFTFRNLFDTMLAASILGREEVGLASILKSELKIDIDKRFQRADWGQRPLPYHLLNYARFDTHYLIEVRDHLRADLISSQRWALAEEDFVRLCHVSGSLAEDVSLSEPKPGSEPCWRIRGSHDLTPQQAAVLQELCKYRDKIAQMLDRPLFKVINDNTLLAIAIECPNTVEELRRLPGMSKGQIQRHGSHLLQAVQRGLKAMPLRLPRPSRPDERFLARLENLRQWRKETGRGLGVKSDVILPRDLLHAIAEKNPQSRQELAVVMVSVPWRLERFGDQILDVLNHRH